jgi:hypothetical protein
MAFMTITHHTTTARALALRFGGKPQLWQNEARW